MACNRVKHVVATHPEAPRYMGSECLALVTPSRTPTDRGLLSAARPVGLCASLTPTGACVMQRASCDVALHVLTWGLLCQATAAFSSTNSGSCGLYSFFRVSTTAS
jgi:hypothetical protein